MRLQVFPDLKGKAEQALETSARTDYNRRYCTGVRVFGADPNKKIERILSSENWIKFLTIALMGIMVWEFEKSFAIKFPACTIPDCKEARRLKHYNHLWMVLVSCGITIYWQRLLKRKS